jgi:4-hydroxy-4-methyl-2-oxoglutarate aldolase
MARLGTATVYEAAGRRGLVDADLVRVVPDSRVAGPARTVRCGQGDNLMVHAVMERVRPGDVLVLTMPAPGPVALVGELLATQAQARRAAGMLIDAAVRDLEELEEMGLPIWARWVRARGATKTRAGELDVPVSVGGAVVVEAERVEEVVTAARAREESERSKRSALQGGALTYDLDGLRAVAEGMERGA